MRRRVRPRGRLAAGVVTVVLGCALAALPGVAVGQSRPGYPHLAGRPNPMRAPVARSAPRLPLGTATATGYGRVLAESVEGAQRPLFLGLLAFYRTVISPVNGDQSDVAPVHSLYAVQAIKAHGVVLGMVLTAERLIHEPDELAMAPPFREAGRTFYYDPLRYNTYWLWQGPR